MDAKLEKDMLRRMENEAIHELLHCHEKSGKQKAKDLIKRIAGRYVPPEDLIFWPAGLLANALAENLDRRENGSKEKEKVLDALRTYFDRWIAKDMPIYYVDDVLCGVALIILYENTGEEKYRAGADKMAEYLFRLEEKEADGQGSIPYRPAQKNKHVYADGIGMMCPFLARYGAAFGKPHAAKLALCQINNMLACGMDDKTGLPYHGFQYESLVKYGIIGWGRAVGWMLMGMAGTLCFLPEGHEREELGKSFRRLVQAAELYQKENGAFSWQLEASEGPEDSSAAAMIAYGVQKGMPYALEADKEKQNGGAGEEAECGRKIVRRAAEYLAGCEKEGRIYRCSGECMGFSQYPQVYGAYPWSLGPAMDVLLGEAERM